MEKTKIKIVELCSGIGCQLRGLENTNCFEPEVVATSEINVDAIVSYAAIHNGLTENLVDNYESYPPHAEIRAYLTKLNIGYTPEKDRIYDWYKSGNAFERKMKKVWLACKLSNNYGDLSKIKHLPQADLWFWSTPCTDISLSGKMRGLNPDDNTRSSLIWQTLRLLKDAKSTDTLPKYMMLENVKNLVGSKFIDDFNRLNAIIEEEFDYAVRWQVINSKNCGIPQNRERVFVVYIRKDVDTGLYEFPKPFDNGMRLKHVLLDNVEDKFYVNTEKADALLTKLIDDGTFRIDENGSVISKNGVVYDGNK